MLRQLWGSTGVNCEGITLENYYFFHVCNIYIIHINLVSGIAVTFLLADSVYQYDN